MTIVISLFSDRRTSAAPGYCIKRGGATRGSDEAVRSTSGHYNVFAHVFLSTPSPGRALMAIFYFCAAPNRRDRLASFLM
ncbi:hypothetical protein Y032_0341g3008 [Ancylostoma ceylanicum]|uniref:Uncharacterized protein n=1 Tax=Ancylostoma ceylanicum TaxID=53326 RepID=A0A016RXV0_9BILA|nr:hypothetical protein Y032_0341g3008 [Ancylostoma ceylanicum]